MITYIFLIIFCKYVLQNTRILKVSRRLGVIQLQEGFNFCWVETAQKFRNFNFPRNSTELLIKNEHFRSRGKVLFAKMCLGKTELSVRAECVHLHGLVITIKMRLH